jgi:predicted dinucleotide-binding enzyme
MPVVGIIGTGQVGAQVPGALIAHGYEAVIAISRGAETLRKTPPARRVGQVGDIVHAITFIVADALDTRAMTHVVEGGRTA